MLRIPIPQQSAKLRFEYAITKRTSYCIAHASKNTWFAEKIRWAAIPMPQETEQELQPASSQ
jgi:hypothetical protein